MSKKKLMICGLVLALVVVLAMVPGMALRLNTVKGIDISHHQGKADWQALDSEDIDFVYIKATEGSSFVDEELDNNARGAAAIDIYYGFYHFVSFDSPAESQMENFLSATKDYDGKLIPALDVEWYGDKRKNPPSKEAVHQILDEMIGIIQDEYGVKPVVYTTQSFYFKYFLGDEPDCPLWIRNVYYVPFQDWAIWQYTEKLDLNNCFENGSAIDGDVTDRKKLEEIMK